MINRRSFVSACGAALAAGPGFAQRGPRFDIVIRNGELRDPSTSLRRKADLGIADGKIAAIEDGIPAGQGRDEIDASGLYVTPGLVDLHTHIYHSATGLGIEADPIAARSGVTTWVDAGSFGHDQTPGFRRFIVNSSQVRIFGYVYLYPSSRNPDIDPVKYVATVAKRTGEAVEKNRDILIGIKMQVGSNMNGRYSYDFLKIARQVCDEFRIPLMAHISFAPPETEQVMALMRAGDVVTHCYNGHSLGIVDSGGKLKPGVQEARDRGVLFDIGHGLGSFNFPAAKKALAAGFVCDTISTDIYGLNVNGPVYDMPTTMTKMLHLGMSFDDVLLRSTANPARIIGRVPGLGTIAVGAPADIAILALEDGQFTLVDSQRNQEVARQRIAARVTICRGRRVVHPA
ncbi:MAG: amidohydrolase/deacetylase family metallohydrolase [Bryobacterales bacterium]|nr:amidohydrolase/deacetylase family metallohydrolase [Bryobacterales bacterium]